MRVTITNNSARPHAFRCKPAGFVTIAPGEKQTFVSKSGLSDEKIKALGKSGVMVTKVEEKVKASKPAPAPKPAGGEPGPQADE